MSKRIDEAFEKFWSEYPRRVTTPRISGKKKCRLKFDMIIKLKEATAEEIIEGTVEYAICDSVAMGYVCLPMTWLNQARWNDEY